MASCCTQATPRREKSRRSSPSSSSSRVDGSDAEPDAPARNFLAGASGSAHPCSDEHVVEGMGPHRDAKSPEMEHAGEVEPGGGAEQEDVAMERLPLGAYVVGGGE